MILPVWESESGGDCQDLRPRAPEGGTAGKRRSCDREAEVAATRLAGTISRPGATILLSRYSRSGALTSKGGSCGTWLPTRRRDRRTSRC